MRIFQPTITGSLTVTDNVTAPSFTGSLSGSALSATSASYASTASYVDLVAGPNITINQVGTSFEISGSGGGGSDTNFANTDLTFTGTRTHDLSGNSLSLLNGGSITLSGSGIFNSMLLKHDTNTLSIQSARTSFNPGNADIDFRVGSVGTDYALNVDGGTDRVSINKNAPNATLDVNGDAIITGSVTVTGILDANSGSFNYIEADSLIKHTGDNGTGITFTSDTVVMLGNTFQNAIFSTTTNTIGNSSLLQPLTIYGNSTISGSLTATGLTQGAGTNTVAMYDTGSGQFFYTASSAIGGGGGSNTNFANTDLTFTANRNHNIDTFEFKIANGFGDIFSIDGTDLRVGVGKVNPNATLDVNGDTIISGSLNVTASFTASGLNYPTADGEQGDTLVTDGTGNLTLEKPTIYAKVKNVSGGTLPKGLPVHASSSVGNTNEVIPASASNAATMPATFILAQELADEEEGVGIVTGFINGVNTSGFLEGQVVYVGADGGYTNVKPTGSNLIQNLGIVTKIDATNGSGFIYGAGRSNDVPNILEGYTWIGNSDGVAIPTPTSSIQNVISSSFASTASYIETAQTASYVLNAVSASYALTASYVETAQTASYVLMAQTASYALNAVSASFASTASFVTASNVVGTVLSASFASTASYILPLNQDVLINGSLNVTTSVTASSFTGSFVGDGSEITGIKAGDTLFVDATFGNDATGTRGDLNRPFLTIGSALAEAQSGDTVIIRAGTYDESNLTISSSISVFGEGWENTRVGNISASNDIFILKQNGYISQVGIYVPTGSFNGILVDNSAGTNGAYNITFYGSGNNNDSAGIGLYKTGGGKIIGAEIRCEGGGLDTLMKVDSGVLAIESTHVPQSAGNINNVLLVTTSASLAGRAQMVGFNSGNTNVANAVCVNGGSSGIIPTALIFTHNIFNASTAICVSGDYESAEFIGGRFENVTYALSSSASGTGVDAIYRITAQHQPDYSYPPILAYNAEFGLDFISQKTATQESSKNLFGVDQMSVGFAERGTEAYIGKGAPYSFGVKVFTTDNTANSTSTGSSILDVSEEAASYEGSSFTFQGTGSNHTILFTTLRKESDGVTPLKPFGCVMDVLQGTATGSYALEIWDGANWTDYGVQAHSDELGFAYSNDLFQRDQSEETMIFGIEGTDTWVTQSISGSTGYFARFRQTNDVGAINQIPTFERLRISSDALDIGSAGIIHLYGKAIYQDTVDINGWSGYAGSLPSDTSLTVGSGTGNQTWTYVKNDSLLNTNNEGVAFNLEIPEGVCTAFPVYMEVTAIGQTGGSPATLDVSFLPLKVQGTPVAIFGDKNLVPLPRPLATAESITSKAADTDSVAMADSTTKIQRLEFGPFSIADYYSGDYIFGKISNPTGANNVTILGLRAKFHKFALGEHDAPYELVETVVFGEDWSGLTATNGWTIVNGGAGGRWVVTDSPISSSAGNDPVDRANGNTNAAYISNASGSTNVYDYSANTNVSHMYADFAIPAEAENLKISFSWQCDGEGGSGADRYDYGTVHLLPTSTTPVAGTELSTATRLGDNTANNKLLGDGPGGNDPLGSTQFVSQSNVPIGSSLYTAGTNARIALSWVSDASLGNQPPIAIGFISVTYEKYTAI